MNKNPPLPLLMTVCLSFGGFACGDSVNENLETGEDPSQEEVLDSNESDSETVQGELSPLETPPIEVAMTAEEEEESGSEGVDVELPLEGGEELETDEDESDSARALVWRNCGQFSERNFECSELAVPVNYEEPDGDQVFIAMRRVVADPLEPYRGALLVNPGGPGGPGIDFALNGFQVGLFDEIAPGFDIIGFDPRGVAQSGERGCGITPPSLYPGAGTASEQNVEESVQFLREYAEGCEGEWGSLFRALGTNNVVRDVEEIRKALGEASLNFLGVSYGTLIAALYAHSYPETTGRIVLDAPVHPGFSMSERTRGQFLEVVRLHEALLSECEAELRQCPPEVRQVFDSLLENARGRDMEQALLSDWSLTLGAAPTVDRLLALLGAEAADPGGDWIDSVYGGPARGDQSLDVASFAVNCTDESVEPPTFEQLDLLRAEFAEVSPLFSFLYLQDSVCMGWPTTPDPTPLPTAVSAPRLLVIGGVDDTRTPFANAQAMTETLGNATLLTSNHYGHAAIGDPGAAGQCARETIRAYFTTGSLPALGAECG